MGGYDAATPPSSFTDACCFFNSQPWVLSQSSDPATCYCLLLHSCDVCLLLHSFLPFVTWYGLECYNSCDGILLSIVISNAGTGFNSNLLIQSLVFVFREVFKISDMMVFVCWRPGMTTVLNLQFSYIVMHNFF